MRELPAHYTVVGYADLDKNVETFTEVVYCARSDAWAVAVQQSMEADPSRDFLRQATEISTFMGICVDVHGGRVDLPSIQGPDLKIDPDVDDLHDLQIYIRTAPPETEGAAPVKWFYWFDTECDEADAESSPFATYAEALADRYEQVTG